MLKTPLRPNQPLALGFTLIELLVVVGILAILLGITVPVVSSMRQSARKAQAQAQVTKIASACKTYNTDFRQFPGLWTNADITRSSVHAASQSVSQTESMLLALAGGIVPKASPSQASAPSDRTIDISQPWNPNNDYYDQNRVGEGPLSGAATERSLAKAARSYIDIKPDELIDVDNNRLYELRDPVAGLPVIYYRANRNTRGIVSFEQTGNTENRAYNYWQSAKYFNTSTYQAITRNTEDLIGPTVDQFKLNFANYITNRAAVPQNAGYDPAPSAFGWSNLSALDDRKAFGAEPVAEFLVFSTGVDGFYAPRAANGSQFTNEEIENCDDIRSWK